MLLTLHFFKASIAANAILIGFLEPSDFPTTFFFFACTYFFSHTTFSLLDDFVETKQNHSYLVEEERVYAKSRFEKKLAAEAFLHFFEQ